ncbi:MAG TPA: MgtC/SapB family protein [Candidatus Angelobacter sp.]
MNSRQRDLLRYAAASVYDTKQLTIMSAEALQLFPHEGLKILVVLFLSFLIGLEREEHKTDPARHSFGGVRTFPLIGLIGYGMALLSGAELVPLAFGFLVVGALLVVSYIHKLATEKTSGVTTEVSALGTYLLGALVYHDQLWIATTIAVLSMFLLELKTTLEGLTKRIAPEEIFTFTKFLLLTAVILPILPRVSFTRFQINPFKTWLVVVAVSTVSYGSYVLLKLTSGKKGVLLSALLGGAYSSTVATIALARRAATEQQPHLFAGGTLVASGMMYVRLALLLALFNHGLLRLLWLPFVVLAGTALVVGWLWSRIPDRVSQDITRKFDPRNPLELRAALMFALLFVGMVVITHLAIVYLGAKGVYALGTIMGLSDVDPFILGITQSAGQDASLIVGAVGIVIAATSNNVIKGCYAYGFADRRTGVQSLSLLLGLALAGLTPLIWLLR